MSEPTMVVMPDGTFRRAAPAGMLAPVSCDFCGEVYDSAAVEVVARYADCSTWRSPCCDRLVDDRPSVIGATRLVTTVPSTPTKTGHSSTHPVQETA